MQNNQLDNNKACQNMTKLDSSAELSMEDLELVSGGCYRKKLSSYGKKAFYGRKPSYRKKFALRNRK